MRRVGTGIPFERAVELARSARVEELEAELGRAQLIGTKLAAQGEAHPTLDEEEEEWSFQTRASRTGAPSRLQIALGATDLQSARVFPVRKAAAQTFFLDVIIIGRAATCDVVIDDGSISKLHARLRERDGEWRVSDANSSNGTYVDGKRIGAGDHPLAFGAVLRLGDWALRFQSLEATRATLLETH